MRLLHGLHSKPTTTTLPGLEPETGTAAPITSPYSVSPSPFLDPLPKSSSVRSLYLNFHCHGFNLASHDPPVQNTAVAFQLASVFLNLHARSPLYHKSNLPHTEVGLDTPLLKILS